MDLIFFLISWKVFLKLLQDSSEKMPCVPRVAHLDHTNGAETGCKYKIGYLLKQPDL